jgi:hypothetical protein
MLARGDQMAELYFRLSGSELFLRARDHFDERVDWERHGRQIGRNRDRDVRKWLREKRGFDVRAASDQQTG